MLQILHEFNTTWFIVHSIITTTQLSFFEILKIEVFYEVQLNTLYDRKNIVIYQEFQASFEDFFKFSDLNVIKTWNQMLCKKHYIVRSLIGSLNCGEWG